MAAVPPSRLRVRLIGELALHDGDTALGLPASRKTRALFVYLLRLKKAVSRERLCDLFFDIPDDPRAGLRWSLSKLRAALGPHAAALVADRERVEIRDDTIVTDVDELVAILHGQPFEGDIHRLAEAALEPPLAGLDLAHADSFNAWLAAERADIDRHRALFLAFAADLSPTPAHGNLYRHEANQLDPPPLGLDAAAIAAVSPLQPDEPIPVPPDATACPPPPPISATLDQQVRYCQSPGGVRIAYAVTGSGPPLVKAANWLNHLELDWSGPVWSRLFSALSARHAFVRYDESGNGLSEWEVDDLSFDAFVRDLETVADTLGLERFPLLGISQGSAVSIEYAARHPERVSRLILLGGYAAGWRHIATPDEAAQREAVIILAQHGWGQDNPAYRQLFSQTFMPSATHDELDWFNDFQRRTATPANAVRFLQAFADIDVRDRLKDVRCPTLVLHARGDQRVPLAQGIQLASEIPGASLVTLETDNHVPLSREPATQRIVECIEAFLHESEPVQPVGSAEVQP